MVTALQTLVPEATTLCIATVRDQRVSMDADLTKLPIGFGKHDDKNRKAKD